MIGVVDGGEVFCEAICQLREGSSGNAVLFGYSRD